MDFFYLIAVPLPTAQNPFAVKIINNYSKDAVVVYCYHSYLSGKWDEKNYRG
jgi:hypothetical protein